MYLFLFFFFFKFVNVFEGNTPCPKLLMNVKFLKRRGVIEERLIAVLPRKNKVNESFPGISGPGTKMRDFCLFPSTELAIYKTQR